MVFRNRDGSSTRTVWLSGSEQEYKLFPSALMTRAMDCVAVKADGGVEVSSAAAKTFRFGRPIFDYLGKIADTVRDGKKIECFWTRASEHEISRAAQSFLNIFCCLCVIGEASGARRNFTSALRKVSRDWSIEIWNFLIFQQP